MNNNEISKSTMWRASVAASCYILFLYVSRLVAQYIVIIALGISVTLIYLLSLISSKLWKLENYYPLLWASNPVGFYYHYFSYFVWSSNADSYGTPINDVLVLIIHFILLANLFVPIFYMNSCVFCVAPFYLYGLIMIQFPQLESYFPYISMFLMFFDTIYHYTSHSRHFSFPETFFFRSFGIAFLLSLTFTGTATLISQVCGFLVSLLLTLPPTKSTVEKLIDPESLIGQQVISVAGQVIFTSVARFVLPDQTMLGAILRGIITGRLILMYTIREEVSSRKIVGDSLLL